MKIPARRRVMQVSEAWMDHEKTVALHLECGHSIILTRRAFLRWRGSSAFVCSECKEGFR